MIRVLTILLLLAAPVARADSAADKLTMAGIAEFTNAYQAWDGARFVKAENLFQQACTNATATVTNYYWLGAGEFHRMLQLLDCQSAKPTSSPPRLRLMQRWTL